MESFRKRDHRQEEREPGPKDVGRRPRGEDEEPKAQAAWLRRKREQQRARDRELRELCKRRSAEAKRVQGEGRRSWCTPAEVRMQPFEWWHRVPVETWGLLPSEINPGATHVCIERYAWDMRSPEDSLARMKSLRALTMHWWRKKVCLPRLRYANVPRCDGGVGVVAPNLRVLVCCQSPKGRGFRMGGLEKFLSRSSGQLRVLFVRRGWFLWSDKQKEYTSVRGLFRLAPSLRWVVTSNRVFARKGHSVKIDDAEREALKQYCLEQCVRGAPIRLPGGEEE